MIHEYFIDQTQVKFTKLEFDHVFMKLLFYIMQPITTSVEPEGICGIYMNVKHSLLRVEVYLGKVQTREKYFISAP